MDSDRFIWKEVSLPSRGLLYGSAKVEMRQLVGEDEIFLSRINPEEYELSMCVLLSRIIRGIDPKELTIGDRAYLSVGMVMDSYSNVYPVDVTCVSCGYKNYIEVDLTTIPVKCLKEGYTEPYKVKLPVSKEEVNLRLLRVKDLISLEEVVKKKSKDSWGMDHLLLLSYAFVDLPPDKAYEKLKRLFVKDISVIRGFLEENVHGPDLRSSYVCSECGFRGEYDIPFRPEIVLLHNKLIARGNGKELFSNEVSKL